MPSYNGQDIAYGDRVKIMAGTLRGHIGVVSVQVRNDPDAPWYVQVWPDSDPDAKLGKMRAIGHCEENLKRLTRRCVECSSVCPENDYLCKDCRNG